MIEDWVNANKRLNLAIRQFSVCAEKTFTKMAAQGNPFAAHILHQIYYRRSFTYRLKHHAHSLFASLQNRVRRVRLRR